MKYEIIIPKRERIGWLIIPIIFVFILFLFFNNAQDNLSSTWFFISFGVILIILVISGIIIISQFITNYIDIKEDGLYYYGEEGKKFIPFTDLNKITIFESQSGMRLHKIVLKTDEIFVNREVNEIESFIKDLEKYIEKSSDKNIS